MQGMTRITKPEKIWETFEVFGVTRSRSETIRHTCRNWHAPMLVDWLDQRRRIEQTLPAVAAFNKLNHELANITTVEDWPFTSNWERAILGCADSVLHTIYDPDDDRNFVGGGRYLNDRGAHAAAKYFALTWSVMNYGWCYMHQHNRHTQGR